MTDLFEYKDNFAVWKNVDSKLVLGDKTGCANPYVSIIIPCYKSVNFIQKAIESALYQDCDFEYEIIVVDNTEGEFSPIQGIVEQYKESKLLYYRNAQNIGMAGNWNRGIELARAPYITYCHADDILLPNCLSYLMELHRKVGDKLILSERNEINEKDEYLRKIDYPHLHKRFKFLIQREYYYLSLYDLLFGNRWNGEACLFIKEHMIELGGFNADYMPSLDFALIVKYADKYGAICNPNPLLNYRFSAIQTSNSCWEEFAKKSLFYRGCIVRRIGYPYICLRILEHTLNHYTKEHLENFWGKRNVKYVTFFDRYIMLLSSWWRSSIKPYRFIKNTDKKYN